MRHLEILKTSLVVTDRGYDYTWLVKTKDASKHWTMNRTTLHPQQRIIQNRMPIMLRLRILDLEDTMFIHSESFAAIKGRGRRDPGGSGFSSEVLSKSTLTDWLTPEWKTLPKRKNFLRVNYVFRDVLVFFKAWQVGVFPVACSLICLCLF